MRRTVSVVLGLCAVGALVECSPFGGGDFTCDGDQSCTGGTGGRCEPSGYCSFADPACTDGQRYGDGPSAGQCVGGEQPVDAGMTVDATLPPDAAVLIDSSIDAAPVRYCVGAFVTVCLPDKPSADYSLPAPFSTDVGPCRTDATDMAGAPLTGVCVVAGANVTANSAVVGSKPLIIISTNKLTVGALDVASHRMTNTIGPGGDAAGCANGVGGDANTGGGGGGGGYGANGGNGGNHAPATAGMAGKKAPQLNALRGGCPGGNGTTANTRGHGGGAVLLIAASTIQIDGSLNASGSGADGAGNGKESGGSGGGSGGLIVLEAGQLTNNGFVIANGGGGASGSSSGSAPSAAGSDPNPAATTAAAGGTAQQNAGNGGAGGSQAKPDGTDGQDGQPFMTTMIGGAGGGGGSVGAILTHLGTLSGNVSPAAQTF